MRTFTVFCRPTFWRARRIAHVRVMGVVLVQLAGAGWTFEIMSFTSSKTEGDQGEKKGKAFHRRPLSDSSRKGNS